MKVCEVCGHAFTDDGNCWNCGVKSPVKESVDALVEYLREISNDAFDDFFELSEDIAFFYHESEIEKVFELVFNLRKKLQEK